MSSTQSFSTEVREQYTKSTSYVSVNLNIASCFPNATAKPIKADFSLGVRRDWYLIGSPTAYASIKYNDVQKCYATSNSDSSYGRSTLYDDTSASVVNYNKGSTSCYAQWRINNGTCSAILSWATATLYFTRYDFSATAGTGVTSASVSSSTGYTGDPITCSCVIPAGYVFDGWYDEEGGFRASTTSFVYTVGTRDHTFTAKAHQNTHSVNGSYYFGTDTSPSTKAILTGITGDVGVSYNNGSKNCTTTLNTTNNSFEIACGGKVAVNNINVGSVPLECASKLMRSNLKLNYV